MPVSRENVQLAAQLTPDTGEDLEFDESGSRLMLDPEGSLDGAAPELANMPRENLIALLKCIARCVRGDAGMPQDLSDTRIAELAGAAAAAPAPMATEVITTGLR